MSITFNQIPPNIRVPGAYIEIDSTRAFASLQLRARILVFGQKLSAGTQAANTPKLITSYADAVTSFGQGSHLANIFEMLFKNNSTVEKWAVASVDGAGQEAAGSLTFTGAPTANGTVSLYCGGVLVSVPVTTSDDVSDIASAVEAAITANLDLPITAEATLGVVDITYRHKGLIGNDYTLQLNVAGESLPAGLACAIVPMSGGTVDPDVAGAIASLPEEIFDYWVIPYTADASMLLFEAELDDRWGPTRMLEGHAFAAFGGTTSTVAAYGADRNSQHVCVIDAGETSPTPAYLWAAAVCGQVAEAATNDPARPFNGIILKGVLAPPIGVRRAYVDWQTLLFTGIATHKVNNDGSVAIQRLITNYQLNNAGVADAAYLDANTLFTLAYMRQTLRARITSRFPRHKLADDSDAIGPGQFVATPALIKGEMIAVAGEWVERGLMEDMAAFKAALIVERDISDRTRINAQIPPNLVNQLHIEAIQISFIL